MSEEEQQEYLECMREVEIDRERKEFLETNRMKDALFGVGFSEVAFDVFAIEFIKKYGVSEFKRVCMG